MDHTSMMTTIMVTMKMDYTRSMMPGHFQAVSQVEASRVKAEAFQAEDSQVKAEEYQAEVSLVEDQAEGSREGSKAEELQHPRRHRSFLKKPRHLSLQLIQGASEGACTAIRMCG